MPANTVRPRIRRPVAAAAKKMSWPCQSERPAGAMAAKIAVTPAAIAIHSRSNVPTAISIDSRIRPRASQCQAVSGHISSFAHSITCPPDGATRERPRHHCDLRSPTPRDRECLQSCQE